MPAVIQVAIVAPLVVRNDAISATARDTFLALERVGRFNPIVLTHRCDFPAVRSQYIEGLSDLLLSRPYLDADVILHEFGVYSPLFDALLVGNGRARQAVRFHNITPPELVPKHQRQTIERAYGQIETFRYASEIWAVSATNAGVLTARGFPERMIREVPLAVDFPARRTLVETADGMPPNPVEVLFVGRIVPSKGVLDLVEAVARLDRATLPPFRLSLAGNLEFSDPAYRAEVEAQVARYGLDDRIAFLGTVDDEALARLYHRAHLFAIPSYHEGFCKPVIEALRAGCVPIGYDAHNLPNVIADLGRVVPTGDVAALSAALAEMLQAIADPRRPLPLDRGPTPWAEFDRLTDAHIARFAPERIAATIVELTAALAGA